MQNPLFVLAVLLERGPSLLSFIRCRQDPRGEAEPARSPPHRERQASAIPDQRRHGDAGQAWQLLAQPGHPWPLAKELVGSGRPCKTTRTPSKVRQPSRSCWASGAETDVPEVLGKTQDFLFSPAFRFLLSFRILQMVGPETLSWEQRTWLRQRRGVRGRPFVEPSAPQHGHEFSHPL